MIVAGNNKLLLTQKVHVPDMMISSETKYVYIRNLSHESVVLCPHTKLGKIETSLDILLQQPIQSAKVKAIDLDDTPTEEDLNRVKINENLPENTKLKLKN